MKEKLFKNFGLKLLSFFLAALVWLGVMNVSNPLTTGTKEVQLEILNEQVLTEAGRTYELSTGKSTVTISYEAHVMDEYQIRASDFRAYIDLTDLYDVTSSVQIKVDIVGNRDLILSAEARPSVVRIVTEELQTKSFELEITAAGTVADGYAVNEILLTPARVVVSGPVSQVGLINHAGVEISREGLSANAEGTVEPVLYDANGNELSGLSKIEMSPQTVQYSVVVNRVTSLPVICEVGGTAAAGFQYTGCETSVQEVSVTGPNSSLSAASAVTIPASVLDVSGAMEDFSITVDIRDYLPSGLSLLSAQDAELTVLLKVERLASRTITLTVDDISMSNGYSDYEYELVPDQIDVVLQGLAADLEQLTAYDLAASVNLSGLEDGSWPGVLNLADISGADVITVSNFTVEVRSGSAVIEAGASAAEETQEEEPGEEQEEETAEDDSSSSGEMAGVTGETAAVSQTVTAGTAASAEAAED